MNNKIITHALAAILGVCIFYYFNRPNDARGQQLTEQARSLSDSADKHLSNAIGQEAKYIVNTKIISAKDKEIANLKNELSKATAEDELGTLKALVIKQDEAIALRDGQIDTLRLQNSELNKALLLQQRAYQVQLDATKAYAEAMSSAQWKGGIKGAIIGLAVGFVAGKH